MMSFAAPANSMAPLTDTPGNPDRGRVLFFDRDAGHCQLCHEVAQAQLRFQGNLGPTLGNVGARLSEAQLRARIVDPKTLNPNSVMPAYFRAQGLNQVAREYQGKSILTAQQIEDIVAYLSSLSSPTKDGDVQ